MKISVFGLGYVGCVTGACFSDLGHEVIGVDINDQKVNMINNGKSPIIEQDIDELIERVSKNGKFKATNDSVYAVKNTDIALICVGTPSNNNGSINLEYIEKVCEEIGQSLKDQNKYFIVVIRSTSLPGTIENLVMPTLIKHSQKEVGKDFGVCMNPEFLREGTSIYDFYNPPKTVIGEYDKRCGDVLVNLYQKINAPLLRTSLKAAEMVKYCDNTFHALKVTFANEIGNICKELSIDSHEVMDIFCQDTKLNLSPYYLKPGFAFGGSCLPKDVRALTYESKTMDIDTPVLNAILDSNKKQILKVINLLLKFKKSQLGFLGLSFKGGTDDLRESPIVEVIETLIGKGFHINIYDKNVSIAKLMGANKDYIINEIPHISSLMRSSVKELVDSSEVIIIANKDPEFKKILDYIDKDKTVFDLVRITNNTNGFKFDYNGICW